MDFAFITFSDENNKIVLFCSLKYEKIFFSVKIKWLSEISEMR